MAQSPEQEATGEQLRDYLDNWGALSSMITIASCFAVVAAFFAFHAHRTQSMWDEVQQKQVFEQGEKLQSIDQAQFQNYELLS